MPSYKTHISATIIPALYLISELDLYNLNPLYPIISLSCCVLGSLLPDIDTPHSFIGRRLLPISWIINRIFHHRGIFHSIRFYTFIFLILPLFHPSNYTMYGVVLISLYTGIVLHIILDKVTTNIKRNKKRASI